MCAGLTELPQEGRYLEHLGESEHAQSSLNEAQLREDNCRKTELSLSCQGNIERLGSNSKETGRSESLQEGICDEASSSCEFQVCVLMLLDPLSS